MPARGMSAIVLRNWGQPLLPSALARLEPVVTCQPSCWYPTLSNFSFEGRRDFFQAQAEHIKQQWKNFLDYYKEEYGDKALVEHDIWEVWEDWEEYLDLDRTQQDCHNPSLIPGFVDNFVIFKAFCVATDPAYYAEYANEEFLAFILKNPEAFFACLFQYIDRPEETRIHARRGKPSMVEVVRMIDRRDAETYIHPLLACKHELVELSGNCLTDKKRFMETFPDERFCARTARLINAYSGYWVNKDKYKEAMSPHLGAYADLRLMYEQLLPRGFFVPLGVVRGEVHECLECGAWSNETLGISINKEKALKLTKHCKTKARKKEVLKYETSKIAEKIRMDRKEKEDKERKAQRTQKRKDYQGKRERAADRANKRLHKALIAIEGLDLDLQSTSDDVLVDQAKEQLEQLYGKGSTRKVAGFRNRIKEIREGWPCGEGTKQRLEELEKQASSWIEVQSN